MPGRLRSILRAMIDPRRIADLAPVSGRSLFALAVSLFALYLTGERLVAGYYRNPEVQLLALREASERVDALMVGAPPEAREQMKARMVQSLAGREGAVFASLSVAMAGAGFLLTVIELWLLSSVVSQFFGGQSDRPTLPLFIMAAFPLAARKVSEGVVMLVRDPAVAANALTMEDYRRLSAVRFDLLRLAGTGILPPLADAFARALTDPFFLWAMAILSIGGAEVYHLGMTRSSVQTAILAAILIAQSLLLARIGVHWPL